MSVNYFAIDRKLNFQDNSLNIFYILQLSKINFKNRNNNQNFRETAEGAVVKPRSYKYM